MKNKLYKVEFSKKIQKFLFSHPEIGKRFFQKVEIMENNPFDIKLDTSKLVGTVDKYRLRIGKYRFLYTVLENIVLIYFYDADSRGDIYK